MERSEPPRSSVIDLSMTRATAEESTVGLGQTSPYETSSGWWVILPWRLGTAHEFTGTQAARRDPGSGHEKAADAGLGLSLWSACDPHALGGDQCGEQR